MREWVGGWVGGWVGCLVGCGCVDRLVNEWVGGGGEVGRCVCVCVCVCVYG